MSYILDALRRADADRERERGAVPGLHARPLAGSAAEVRSTVPAAAWMALAGGVLALLAVLAWWVLRSPSDVPPGPVATAPVSVAQLPVAPVAAAPGGVQPAVPQAAAVPAAVPAAATAPPPVLQMPQVQPPPAQRLTAVPQAPRQPPVQAQRPLPPAPQASAVPAPRPQPAENSAPKATPLADVPPELRREMPPMSVGGSIYSDSPASRFVMVNGQVVREGEAAAAGVLLERIGPKSAVLRWRDMRIEVPL